MAEIDIDIESEKENELMNRRELTLRVYHGSSPTPERKVVEEKISELTGFDKDRVIVDSINPEFGKDESKVIARLYEKKDDVKKYEREYMLERN